MIMKFIALLHIESKMSLLYYPIIIQAILCSTQEVRWLVPVIPLSFKKKTIQILRVEAKLPIFWFPRKYQTKMTKSLTELLPEEALNPTNIITILVKMIKPLWRNYLTRIAESMMPQAMKIENCRVGPPCCPVAALKVRSQSMRLIFTARYSSIISMFTTKTWSSTSWGWKNLSNASRKYTRIDLIK